MFVTEQSEDSEEAVYRITDYLNKYRIKLRTAQNPSHMKFSESFEEQLLVLLEERVPLVRKFSFIRMVDNK